MSELHPYIASFVLTMQTAGYDVCNIHRNSPRSINVEVADAKGKLIELRAWVARLRLANGNEADYGYVEITHDVRIGRSRLLDWTNLSSRAEFRLSANGIGAELRRLLR